MVRNWSRIPDRSGGGRKRDRTSDLGLVRAALSQLSYPPVLAASASCTRRVTVDDTRRVPKGARELASDVLEVTRGWCAGSRADASSGTPAALRLLPMPFSNTSFESNRRLDKLRDYVPEDRRVFPNLTVRENPEVLLLYVLENGAVRDEGPMPEFLAGRGERVAHGNLLFLSGVGPGQSTPGLNLLLPARATLGSPRQGKRAREGPRHGQLRSGVHRSAQSHRLIPLGLLLVSPLLVTFTPG